MSDQLSAADIAEGRCLDGLATHAPWFVWDRGVGYLLALDPNGDRLLPEGLRTDFGLREDAELAVWARNRLPALLDAAEAVARIKALHVPTNGHNPDCECGIPPHANRSCTECRTAWPCATVRAINPEENRS